MKQLLAIALLAVLATPGCSYFADSPFFLKRESPLEFYQRISGEAEVNTEIELSRLRPGNDRGEIIAGTKTAMLISLADDATGEDEDVALMLLESLEDAAITTGLEEEYQQFGTILSELLNQRRLLREVDRDLGNMRDRVDTLVSENGRLESQIEALKTIETQQNERQLQEISDGAGAE